MHDVLENDAVDREGNIVSLQAYVGKPMLLVFLRWLG